MGDNKIGDIFRPKSNQAQAIYDAFQKEASLRAYRKPDEWKSYERYAVLNAARAVAGIEKIASPTIDDVVDAENYAVGHIDFGAKWAYRLLEIMRKKS